MIASRFILIPVLAAVGYEILRFGARYRRNPLVKVIMYPGILVQMITTKRPDDDMIEVAITSMQEALVADGNPVPEGSEMFERRPLELGGAPVSVSDLDAKLAEIAAQYDDLHAELAAPRGHVRSRTSSVGSARRSPAWSRPWPPSDDSRRPATS